MRARHPGAISRPTAVALLAVLALLGASLPAGARPYGVRGRPGEVRYGVDASEVERRCSTMTDSALRTRSLCFHWMASGPHQASPAWVDATVKAFEAAWNAQVVTRGYRRPLGDAGKAAGQGPNGGIDIYLADIGADGSFGYCEPDVASDPDGENPIPVFCVVDNDFAEFPSNPSQRVEELRGTAAHEFFHAVQHAYDPSTPEWFSEGTAVWMEDQGVFDDGNTNYRYLDVTALRQPEDAFDRGRDSQHYGSWLFWQFLAEAYAPRDVRETWYATTQVVASDDEVFAAVESAAGQTLGRVLSRFGAWNYGADASWSYNEGDAYLDALGGTRPPLEANHTLDADRTSTDATGSSNQMRQIVVSPYSVNYVRLRAGVAMDLDVTVLRPGWSSWMIEQSAGVFAPPRAFPPEGAATISLEAGQSAVLVLANPTALDKALTYRAVAQ